MTNLYHTEGEVPDAKQFEDFYKDIFVESAFIGEVLDMVVCENQNDHLNGNVYIKFKSQEDAQKARDSFSSRWYNGRPVYCELSPVADFREATCRQHDTQSCERGGMCNFMHSKKPSRELQRQLMLSQKKYLQTHSSS
jgi:splicing factor U2AF subunit